MISRYVRPLLLLLILSTLPGLAAATEITGQVVAVHDGDTIRLLDSANHTTKIRLSDIDAPEMSQPYGAKAKQVLANLVFGKPARVDVQGLDRYGRSIGRVFVNNVD